LWLRRGMWKIWRHFSNSFFILNFVSTTVDPSRVHNWLCSVLFSHPIPFLFR
jgi:hypothetical protein